MGGALTSLLRRARNYMQTVIWCLALFVRHDWKLAVLAFVLGLAAPALQGVGVLLLSLFSALFMGEQGFNVPIVGPFFFALAPIGQVAFLLAALIASSLSYYQGRWLYVYVGSSAFTRWLEDLVAAREALPDPRRPTASKLLLLRPRELLRGLRRTSLAAIQIAEVLPKLLAALVASAILIYTQPLLMLLAFVLFGIAALFLVPTMMTAVKATQRLQEASDAYRRALGDTKRQPDSSGQRAKNAKTAFARRYLVGPVITLVLGIGSAIAVSAAVLFLVTSQAMDQQTSLAPLVAFLGTLQIALAGYSRGLSALASLSRFYEMIQQFRRYRLDLGAELATPLAEVSAQSQISLRSRSQPEGFEYSASAPLALVGVGSKEEGQVALLSARDAASNLPLTTCVAEDGRAGQAAGQLRSPDGLQLVWAKEFFSDEEPSPVERQRATEASTLAPGLVILYRKADKVGMGGEQTLGLVRDGRLVALAERGSDHWRRLLNASERNRAARSKHVTNDEDEG